MTDDNQTEAAGNGGRKPKTRRRFLIGTLLLASGLTGAAAAHGFSGHGFGHRWHGGGFMHAHMTPAEIEGRIDKMVRHIAIEIDASNEQRERLIAIAKSAVGDILPLRDQLRSGRDEVRNLLLDDDVDREAIEALRSEKLASLDAITKRMTAAMADAAEVLTPGQRRVLAARAEELHGFRRRWGRW